MYKFVIQFLSTMLDINFSRFFLKIFVKRISLEKYIVESKSYYLKKLNNNCCHYRTHGKKSKRKRESKSIPAWLWPDVDRIAVSPAVPLHTTKRCTMWLWFWISGQAGRRKKQLIHGRTHIRGRSGGNRTRWFNWAHMLDAWSQKPKKEWTQIPKMKSLGAVGNRLLWGV